MKHRSFAMLLAFAVCLAMAASPAYAQGGATTATLSGVVSDSSGGVIPGASVVVKDTARGTEYPVVTGPEGGFTVPSLVPGTYTVTVSLEGFKTAILSNVVMNAGVSNAVRIKLEVGALEETVTVAAQTEIVQTQSATVAQTLNTKQINSLPLTSRSVMDFLANLPGMNVASDVRNSSIAGLPSSAVNITLDGMNVQDNYYKSGDGMFSLISPRVDAIEEVSLSSAANSADAGGQGAAQIRFTTRGGTNDFRGSAYFYHRDHTLNANTWFNNRDKIAKPSLQQQQPGFRVGGPVLKDKLFFFFNYEEIRTPSSVSRTRTILSPLVEQGKYAYLDTAGNVQTIDLMNFTEKNGTVHTSQMDPTIRALFADIRKDTAATGSLVNQTDPLYQSYSFNLPVSTLNRFPTTRWDYAINPKHRLTVVGNYQRYWGDRDTTNSYEGQFPSSVVYDGQNSRRYAYSATWRAVFTGRMVNEMQYGGSGSPIFFRDKFTPAMFTGSVYNQQGFILNMYGNAVNMQQGAGRSSRNAWTRTIQDSLSWMKGSHSIVLGGMYSKIEDWSHNQTVVPSVSFGLVNNTGGAGVDPVLSWLTSSNLPSGVSASTVQNLYAFLTGRVSQVSGTARLDGSGQYVYAGQDYRQEKQNTYAAWVSDSWRMKPNLTLSGGLRYELIGSFSPLNSTYSNATINDVFGITGPGQGFVPGSLVTGLGNLFHPGTLQGVPCITNPTSYSCFTQYKEGDKAFATDANNLAPTVGVNWSPTLKNKTLAKVFGDQPILRGGFSIGYSRPAIGDFSGNGGYIRGLAYNPGASITVARNTGNNNLLLPGQTLPLLLSNPSGLGPAAFPSTPTYPMTDSKTQDVTIFDPNLQMPYAETYSFGWQRTLTKTAAIEARYVGTRSRQGWTAYNYNEIDIEANHFVDEFKLAMNNLQANIAAGKGNTFAYTGATGTSPLPIYLAYFQGLGASAANDPKNYTSSNFSSSTYYNALAQKNPAPFTAAGTGTSGLNGSQSLIDNAVKAGLAPNFFMVNPDLRGGAYIVSNGGYTKYDSLQAEFRYRPARGLRFDASYTWGQTWGSTRYSFKVDRVPTQSTGGTGGITHTLRGNWVYDLPFGQGKAFGSGVGRAMDNVIGGWSVNGILRVQSGRLVDLGNVRLVGMTEKDVHDMFKLRIDPTTQKVYMFPQDVIDNSVRAFDVNAVSATGYGSRGVPTGKYFAPASGPDCIETISTSYGQCGTRSLIVSGPMFARVDMSINKRLMVTRTVTFEFMAQVINVFNRVNFNPVGGIGNNPDSYEIRANNGGAQDMRSTQISFRMSW